MIIAIGTINIIVTDPTNKLERKNIIYFSAESFSKIKRTPATNKKEGNIFSSTILITIKKKANKKQLKRKKKYNETRATT
jgi:hypothetical protein